MKSIVAGIVAHVDAGKTTLSEAMLFKSGVIRKLGRVDDGDAFLDSDTLEKKRGITIFSHQAELDFDELKLTLLDTPGHMDFASQTEAVLNVLDYAILVVSATDGIQGYTRTLWELLKRYNVPTFIFINKADAATAQPQEVLQQLQTEFASGIQNFSELNDDVIENIAATDDETLNEFLANETLTDQTIQQLIQKRLVFPTYFGSALKDEGVEEFIAGLSKWTAQATSITEFSAKVFKISHDEKGERLTWVKVTGGVIKPKDTIADQQKANQLRVYNGTKFELSSEVSSGEVCAITGLTNTFPGQGLGDEINALAPILQPVLNYAVQVSDDKLHACLTALRMLEDEDPQLHVKWSEHLQEIRVQIMGEVQLEVLQQIMQQRFGLEVSFTEGQILYKETITEKVEGVGHFEPLRHYAEVHLLLEPAPLGSGINFATNCDLDYLGKNWQHQVLSNLAAKEHIGVLTGSPITGMKITLISGKASNVHSVGGDFREATWRAVRQGLMMLKTKGKCQLLEPWYRFKMTVAQDQVGRAMNDIQKMSGTFDTPTNQGELATLTGTAPVAQMQGYPQTLRSYTHGQGDLELVVAGYQACHNAAEVVEQTDYHPVSDLENTPDSVFCAHGAGYPVPWDEVPNMAHIPYTYK
ncbi:elongation factor G [Companilactobacillus zhongbaensis]|uniref:elongation factor G n=1 Tax=Companilactobacillus zhongbaensis TaxID=2486009 RepID=UPI000F76818D|nr:TetM/TetW/TetO/TetS family tetracycline resistance ribosomal protection protein [Companilactobacillus zhongbaensis]